MSTLDDLRSALRAHLNWREGNLSQFGLETVSGSHYNQRVARFRVRDYLTSATKEIGWAHEAEMVAAANALLDEISSIRKERNRHATPTGGSQKLAAASARRAASAVA